MKRLNIIEKSLSIKNPNFIGCWNIENNDLCNEIITWFEKNKNLQKKGITSLGKISNYKKRTDIAVRPNTLDDVKFKCLNNYINELYKCHMDYNSQWPLLRDFAKNLDIGSCFCLTFF